MRLAQGVPMTYKAFVSSTFEDLVEHRHFVVTQLRKAGFMVDPMEDWTAASDEPKLFSTNRVQGCDLMVLLVAFRRGHVPTGEKKSITQLEYETARSLQIDVMPFLLDEDARWQRKFDELDKDPAIKIFRRKLVESHGVGFFSQAPESIEIAPAVSRWLATRKQPIPEEQARPRRIAILRWLTRLPDSLNAHFHEILRIASNEAKASTQELDRLASEAREITNLSFRLIQEMPRAFASTNSPEQTRRLFEESYAALKRESATCIDVSLAMRDGVQIPVNDSGYYDVPPLGILHALDGWQHLRILRMVTESIRDLFPPEDVEDSIKE